MNFMARLCSYRFTGVVLVVDNYTDGYKPVVFTRPWETPQAQSSASHQFPPKNFQQAATSWEEFEQRIVEEMATTQVRKANELQKLQPAICGKILWCLARKDKLLTESL